MAISLVGSTESIGATTLDNPGYGRRLSVTDGCQTCGRGSPTRNQPWLAGARGRYFSRPDRSLCKRRDRKGRPRTYQQGTRSQPDQQTHLPEVGYVPARGGETLSRSRMAQKTAHGPQNQRARSKPDVPLIREGHALGIDSVGTQSDGFGRTQGSQQTSEAASHFDGGGVWGSSQSACSSLSLYGPPRWMHRTSCEQIGRGH